MSSNSTTQDQVIRLSYKEKVSINSLKEAIQSTFNENLHIPDKVVTYDGEKSNLLAKSMADTIRNKLKALGQDRYKYVVTVVVGERREQGIRMGTRCFWDNGTDNQASETFTNDHIFATATAYAIYLY